MVNQITADQQRFLCHNSINLNCFTICTDMWDAAAKGQEQVYGENSFWQKHLLTVTWIHCATLTWGWADLAALCWSGRPLVQLHTLHYLWLPSEPLWWQFWAINWLRITGELGRGLYSPTGCSITSSLLPEGDSRMVSIPRPLVSWLPHHHLLSTTSLLMVTLPSVCLELLSCSDSSSSLSNWAQCSYNGKAAQFSSGCKLLRYVQLQPGEDVWPRLLLIWLLTW